MIKIYIDVYFFLNFAIDFLSLYSAERFNAKRLSLLRTISAAIVGGIWGILFLFFPYLFPLHLPVAWLMVVLSAGIEKSIKISASFIIIEMLIGGVIKGADSLFSLFPKNSLRLFAVIILGIIVSFSFYYIFEIKMKKRLYCISISAKISNKGTQKKVTLLIDSGNLAREPSTSRRVIFVKEKKITGLFDFGEGALAIPIRTTSGTSIKYGFIPQKIHFDNNKYNKEYYVIVPDTEECEFGGYDGIIGVI